MAVARRVLTLLIAAALALAPMGASAASARMHSDAVAVAAPAGDGGSHHSGPMAKVAKDQMPCCPSQQTKSECTQFCLQKCFGPLAVVATGAGAPTFEMRRFMFAAAESPPEWSSAPQPPPPRT